jgi:hypothetical protein
MNDAFQTHTVDSEKEYERTMAKSEAIRRSAEVGDVTPRVTPEETDLSGGEQSNGRTPASR